MGIINGLVKLGITAGAVYAAIRVSDKYKENNPEELKSTEDKIDAVKQAAGEVYAEVSDIIKDKAPGVKDAINDTIQKASDFASEKMPGVVEKVQEAIDVVAEKAPGVAEKVQGVVNTVTEKFVGGEATVRSADEQFEDVVDAEYTPVEEAEKPKEE